MGGIIKTIIKIGSIAETDRLIADMTVGAKMPVCTEGPIAVANLDQCYVLQHDGSFIDARSSCSLDSNGHSRRRIDILDSFKSFSNSEPMKAVFSKQKTDIFVWNNAVAHWLEEVYSPRMLGHMALWQTVGNAVRHAHIDVDSVGFFAQVVPRMCHESMNLLNIHVTALYTIQQLESAIQDRDQKLADSKAEIERLRKNMEEQKAQIDRVQAQLKGLMTSLNRKDLVIKPETVEHEGLAEISKTLAFVDGAIEQCHLLCLIEASPEMIEDIDMLLKTDEVLTLFDDLSTVELLCTETVLEDKQ